MKKFDFLKKYLCVMLAMLSFAIVYAADQTDNDPHGRPICGIPWGQDDLQAYFDKRKKILNDLSKKIRLSKSDPCIMKHPYDADQPEAEDVQKKDTQN